MNPAMAFYKTPINQISMFILLDLLGEAEPRLPSYFPTTHWAYRSMAIIEERMRSLGLLESKPRQPFLHDKDKQTHSFMSAQIQDDHLPFLARGVPVLHLIPNFPTVWHTIADDGEHLDMPTVRDWARIVTAFAPRMVGYDGGRAAADSEEGSKKVRLGEPQTLGLRCF